MALTRFYDGPRKGDAVCVWDGNVDPPPYRIGDYVHGWTTVNDEPGTHFYIYLTPHPSTPNTEGNTNP